MLNLDKTFKAKIILEVEIKATDALEAEEILQGVYGCDTGDLEIKVHNCDVALVGNFAKVKSIV